MSAVQHDLGQLTGDVVFGTGVLLGDRRPDTDRRSRNVLPDEHFGSSFRRVQSQQLAIGGADSLEKIEDFQRVQIVHRLPSMLLQVAYALLGLCERGIKLKLALRRNLFLRGGLVEGGKLVMD